MDDRPPGVRRACVAFAIQSPSGHADGTLASAEQWLSSALVHVCSSAGLDRMLLNDSGAGEGQVALLPVGIDEPSFVAALVDGLLRAVTRRNARPFHDAPVRLTLAFHEGITTLDEAGFDGCALAKVRRLAQCQQLRAVLDRQPRATLAVLLTDQIFEGIGDPGHPGLPADQFDRVEIAGPAGEPGDVAWIYVPDVGAIGAPNPITVR